MGIVAGESSWRARLNTRVREKKLPGNAVKLPTSKVNCQDLKSEANHQGD
jgi:hypothetical protein